MPSTVTLPEVGCKMPESILMVVDFPAPFFRLFRIVGFEVKPARQTAAFQGFLHRNRPLMDK